MTRRYLFDRKTTRLLDSREIVHVYGCDNTSAVSVASGGTQTILTITVPQQLVLLVTHFSSFLDELTALSFITWKMYIDGILVPNYDNITTTYGLSSYIHEVKQDIIVPENSVLTVTGTNNSGFTYRVGAGVYGIFGIWKHNEETI